MTSIFDRHMSRGTADRLTRQFEAAGNRIADLRKQGICTHGWLQGPPGPIGTPGKATCLHCGEVFPSTDAAHAAGRAAMRGN